MSSPIRRRIASLSSPSSWPSQVCCRPWLLRRYDPAARADVATGVSSSAATAATATPVQRRTISSGSSYGSWWPDRAASATAVSGMYATTRIPRSIPLHFGLRSTSAIPTAPSRRSLSSYAFASPSLQSPYRTLDKEAVADLFHQYAQMRDGQYSLDANDICELLKGIGEQLPDQKKIEHLFRVADLDGNGVIDMDEFLENADTFIRDNPARIILIIGGPGSGKGVLSRRLEAECNVVHLSSGSLLRDEVERQTALGREVQDIMASGRLVSSAIMVALMKKTMRDHPGKRVLLDGFPRSLENAHDLVTLCGKPELALHLVCDDTILMERILKRGENREDDNFETALQRIRTYHKFHAHTLEWLKEQHVPIVNLDGTGPPDSVWYQMTAIGKLMRPAVKLQTSASSSTDDPDEDWSCDPQRSSALF